MRGHRYSLWLSVILLLFCVRVTAQLIQSVFPVPYLPPFDAWHSGALPYSALVAAQFVIIGISILIIRRVRADTIRPSPWKYRTCFLAGAVYFSIMVFRTFAGLTFLPEDQWFSKTLPALFHIVLSTFLLLLGHYLYRQHEEPKRLLFGREQDG